MQAAAWHTIVCKNTSLLATDGPDPVAQELPSQVRIIDCTFGFTAKSSATHNDADANDTSKICPMLPRNTDLRQFRFHVAKPIALRIQVPSSTDRIHNRVPP